MTEYVSKDKPGLGRIELNLRDIDDKEYVIIRPDQDQSENSIALARKWINNNFLKDSPYKSGIVSFTKKEWRKKDGGGQKFINAIKQSNRQITWVDKSNGKRIMKGLSAIIPPVSPGGVDLTSPFGGPPGDLSGSLTGMGGNISSVGPPAPSSIDSALTANLPPSTEPSTSPKESLSMDMKSLLLLWERNKHVI